MSDINELNEKQKEAVLHTEGSLVIIAGAGAGKTKTVVSRIIHLIEKGVDPKNILAISFTNKAASEMRERVAHSIKDPSDHQPFISTFHALCVYILRQNHLAIGYSKYFSILDRGETLSVIKESMKEAGINPKDYDPKIILRSLSNYKNKGLDLEKFKDQKGDSFFDEIIEKIWIKYQEKSKKRNFFDFDDLILETVLLLEKNKNILERYQKEWRYIHIDEYQDTNNIQYRLSKLLAGPDKNICIVGDIDQSIYSWRGADFENILRFEKDFPNTKTVLLEENYRSTKNIIEVANQVIKKNKNRVEKNLFTNKEQGEYISFLAGFDEYDEARSVAEIIQEKIHQGEAPNEIAVLYRANFQSRVLEEIFIENEIPYHLLGIRFFERKEIKDILAYLKFSLNKEDFESLKRIINTPTRGIGKATLAKVASGQEDMLSTNIKNKLNEFYNLIKEIEEKTKTKKVSEVLKYIFEKSGLEKNLKEDGPEGVEKIENARELIALAGKYNNLEPEDGLQKFLDTVSLSSDQDSLESAGGGVRLSTVHAVKGLEFNVVFITGLEQDLFPHSPINENESRDEEEERRLFYVAITRAKKKLYLSYANSRTIFGSNQINMPSEFLSDIDPSLIEENEIKPQKTFYLD